MSYLPLKEEGKNNLIVMAGAIIKDINEVWNYYKQKDYSFTPKEILNLQLKLKVHQKRLNEYIEEYSIVKRCTRCKQELPATSNYFYKDRRAKIGLRPECTQRHRTLKRESYQKKMKQYT